MTYRIINKRHISWVKIIVSVFIAFILKPRLVDVPQSKEHEIWSVWTGVLMTNTLHLPF